MLKNIKTINRKVVNMDKQKIKLADLKRLQVELQSQLDSIKRNIEQLEKEIDSQNCPILSRINEHLQTQKITQQQTVTNEW